MKHALKLFPAVLLALSVSANAAVTITMQEVDGDVVISGEGSINSLDGLTRKNGITSSASFEQINPGTASIAALPRWYSAWLYVGFAGPSDFGGGRVADADAQIVNSTGFSIGDTEFTSSNPETVGLALPVDYVLGRPINFSMIYEAKTLDDLGINAGTYEWKWGTVQDDVDGDSVILNVIAPIVPPPATPTPVPALGAFGLMGLASAIGAAGISMNRRRKQ